MPVATELSPANEPAKIEPLVAHLGADFVSGRLCSDAPVQGTFQ